MKKEYIVYAIVFMILCAIFHFWTKNSIESNTPPFISDKLSQLKGDKKLMDSIGGFGYFEFSYNKNDFKLRDTVRYSITIKGDKRVLNYRATQLKDVANKWTEIKNNLQIEDK
jgi:hypothetical protein